MITKIRRIMRLISLFLIPLLCYIGMLVFALPKADFTLFWFGLISLFGIVLGFVLAVFIHELGHGVFGYFNEYKLLSFKFLCFEIYRDAANCYHLKTNSLNGIVLGQCLMMPPKSKKNKEKHFRWYNEGGLIFSFLWLLLLIVLYLISNIYIRWLWMGMVLINVFLIINNASYMEGGVNDRCNGKMVKANPNYVDTINYQLAVVANLYLGKRFGAKVGFKPYYEDKLNHISLPVIEFLIYHEIDRGNFEKVKEYSDLLDKNYHKLMFVMQKIIVNFDLMWSALVVDKNQWQFRKYYKRINNKQKIWCLKENTDMNFYYRMYTNIYNNDYNLTSFIAEIKEAKCFYSGEKLSLIKKINYLEEALRSDK